MSDATLRDLEHRWRLAPSTESEAAWLRARIRAGDLAPERIELCAHLRHPGTLSAMDLEPDPIKNLHAWTAALASFGSEVDARSVVGLGRLELASWRSPWTGREAAESTLFAVEDWTLQPTPSNMNRLRSSLDPLLRETEVLWAPEPRRRSRARSRSKRRKQRARLKTKTRWIERRIRGLNLILMLALLSLQRLAVAPYRELGPLLETTLSCSEIAHGTDQFLEGIRAEVVPWALGYGDPLLERSQARASVLASGGVARGSGATPARSQASSRGPSSGA